MGNRSLRIEFLVFSGVFSLQWFFGCCFNVKGFLELRYEEVLVREIEQEEICDCGVLEVM